ncbi:hypothetical protein BIY29_17640 [Brenneria alni]|uniref:Uncharacterized protein n=2 Tax=Brenneria alni TaxID=71656 RepID=A0A421DJI8_9GAMM|nr:hypothetical protein BIY29_17640 [Brenneria alni]
MFIALQITTDRVRILKHLLAEELEGYMVRVTSGRNLSQHFHAKYLTEVSERYGEIEHGWNIMVKNQRGFFTGNKHVKALFTVKDELVK